MKVLINQTIISLIFLQYSIFNIQYSISNIQYPILNKIFFSNSCDDFSLRFVCFSVPATTEASFPIGIWSNLVLLLFHVHLFSKCFSAQVIHPPPMVPTKCQSCHCKTNTKNKCSFLNIRYTYTYAILFGEKIASIKK